MEFSVMNYRQLKENLVSEINNLKQTNGEYEAEIRAYGGIKARHTERSNRIVSELKLKLLKADEPDLSGLLNKIGNIFGEIGSPIMKHLESSRFLRQEKIDELNHISYIDEIRSNHAEIDARLAIVNKDHDRLMALVDIHFNLHDCAKTLVNFGHTEEDLKSAMNSWKITRFLSRKQDELFYLGTHYYESIDHAESTLAECNIEGLNLSSTESFKSVLEKIVNLKASYEVKYEEREELLGQSIELNKSLGRIDEIESDIQSLDPTQKQKNAIEEFVGLAILFANNKSDPGYLNGLLKIVGLSEKFKDWSEGLIRAQAAEKMIKGLKAQNKPLLKTKNDLESKLTKVRRAVSRAGSKTVKGFDEDVFLSSMDDLNTHHRKVTRWSNSRHHVIETSPLIGDFTLYSLMILMYADDISGDDHTGGHVLLSEINSELSEYAEITLPEKVSGIDIEIGDTAQIPNIDFFSIPSVEISIPEISVPDIPDESSYGSNSSGSSSDFSSSSYSSSSDSSSSSYD